MPTQIAIDVDQTILDDDGNLIAGVREDLAKLKRVGMTLQLWSKGGADYARETAEKFNLHDFFSAYAAKPDVSIDDLPEDAHPFCTIGTPFCDAVKSLTNLVADSLETTLCPSQAAVKLVAHLQKKRRNVERNYAAILRQGTPLHPIPFFGNIDSAQVLTVGLNPSSTEFEAWRSWPNKEMDSDTLARRLTSYFRLVNPKPHPWFAGFQEALGIIGANYKINAAHVDLSPWSTLAPTTLARKANHKKLLKQYGGLLELGQTQWLPQVLKLCAHQMKLLIIVDSNQVRAAKTAKICKTKLGGEWSGEIFYFTAEYRLKCWAWENRDKLRKKLGSYVLYD
ncbi:MAG: hypothetical protein WCK81_14455 [Betaproteobacteria bacterium]